MTVHRLLTGFFKRPLPVVLLQIFLIILLGMILHTATRSLTDLLSVLCLVSCLYIVIARTRGSYYIGVVWVIIFNVVPWFTHHAAPISNSIAYIGAYYVGQFIMGSIFLVWGLFYVFSNNSKRFLMKRTGSSQTHWRQI